MSEAVMQATIRAFDEFSQQFDKFERGLKKVQQTEEQVTTTTVRVNDAMMSLIQAKTKATEASKQFAKASTDLARAEKISGEQATALNLAFLKMQEAEKGVETETKRLTGALAAQGIVGKEAQLAIQRVDSALGGLNEQHKNHMDHSQADMMQTMALISVLYGLKQAMADVIQTGREFELTTKQTQAVTGDFSTMFRDMAMESKGGQMDVNTPRELAAAYRELGQAGASSNDIMAATPDILEFGIAALLDTADSTYAVSSTLKAFNIPAQEAGVVTDAFTEAMNRGAIAGKDFQWIMATSGAVAKMAGQDFQEILAVGSTMRDAGIQAQDAGTSIKSAMIALMSPSKEARGAMEDLGVKIYDASGRMKQWHEIVGEFEKALKPYNEESQQMALATIFGTDGIRAMATSLNKGSEYLNTFTIGLKNAEGSTHRMASAMSDSFDGAIRRTNASLERAKVLIAEDFAQSFAPALQGINTMLIGFNNLDSSSRALILRIIGGAGLLVALKALIGTLQMMGLTMQMLLNPFVLVTGAVVALTGAYLTYRGMQEMSAKATLEAIEAKREEISQIQRLSEEFNQLSKIQKPSNDEQDRLKQVTSEITRIMPTAIDHYDKAGTAIATMGSVSKAAATEMSKLNDEMKIQAKAAATVAEAQLPDLQEKRRQALFKQSQINESLSLPSAFQTGVVRKFGGMGSLYSELFEDEKQTLQRAAALGEQANQEAKAAIEAVTAAENAIKLAQSLEQGLPKDDKKTAEEEKKKGGDKNWSPASEDKRAAATKKAVDAAKLAVDQLKAAMYPFQASADTAAATLEKLTIKEQLLTQVLKDGRGTVAQAVELEKTRATHAKNLNDQQTALNKLADQERAALDKVSAAMSSARNPAVVKVYREEMVRLVAEIDKAGATWWQLEAQKTQAAEQVYNDMYQKSMDLLKHESAMYRMSYDEQANYLAKLRTAYSWTANQIKDIDEELYRIRKKQLSDQLDSLDEAYRSTLSAIEDRSKETISALEDQIKAVDAAGKKSDREEAERKHNDKLAELEKNRLYHSERTGAEHIKALAETAEQVAEENRAWTLKQDEWSRQDKKEDLQEKIKDARDAAEQERKDLEEHYRLAKKIAEDGIFDVIAGLAATGPKWMETGKQLIAELIKGLESGDFTGINSKIDQIRSDHPGSGSDSTLAPAATTAISPNQYSMISGKAAMASRDLANLLGGLSVSWDQTSGKVTIGGKTFNPLKVESGPNGRSFVGIREVAEALGYGVNWDEQTQMINLSRSYDKGGPIWETGPATVHSGEYMIPANLVDAIRRGSPAPTSPGWTSGGGNFAQAIEAAADRIVGAIESRMGVSIDKLLNIESYEPTDEADVDVLMGGLRRAVLSLAGAK
ncbi:MAG: phage tail tape measure protein [Carboxydocellales bacterium]